MSTNLTRDQLWLLNDMSLSSCDTIRVKNPHDIEALEEEWMVKASLVGYKTFVFQVTPRGSKHAEQWRKMQVMEAQSQMEKTA